MSNVCFLHATCLLAADGHFLHPGGSSARRHCTPFRFELSANKWRASFKTAFSSQESIMAAQTLSRIRKPFFRAKLIKHGSAVETSPSWQRFIMKREYLFGCQPAVSGTINQAYLCNVSFNQCCLACSVPFDIICMQ